MKKRVLLSFSFVIFLLGACSSGGEEQQGSIVEKEKEIQGLEQIIRELKVENGELKIENERLKKGM